VSAALSLFLTACDHPPKSAVRGAEADALTALAARADRLAGEDQFSGSVLVAKDGRVLFSHAYGLADRKRRIPNKRPRRPYADREVAPARDDTEQRPRSDAGRVTSAALTSGRLEAASTHARFGRNRATDGPRDPDSFVPSRRPTPELGDVRFNGGKQECVAGARMTAGSPELHGRGQSRRRCCSFTGG
jgi:hypothetical protein